jgi:hypothetical protein
MNNKIYATLSEIIFYKNKIKKNKSQSCFIQIDEKKHKLLINRFDDLYFVDYDINIYIILNS